MRRAGRSVSALAAGEIVNKATRFVATVILARALELDEFGLVNVGIAISGIMLSLSALGMPDFGARAVAVEPGGVPRLTGLVLGVRLTALAAVAGFAIGGTLIFSTSDAPLVVLAAAMAVGLSGSVDWLLRGREQMADAAAATAFGGLVVLAGCASVVLLRPTVAVALSVFAVGELAAALMTWLRARPGRPEVPSLTEARRALRTAWPLGASGLVIYASYANLDTIVLAAVRSDAEAGLYSAPYRLFLAASAVSIFAASALLPMLSRSHSDGRTDDGRRLLARACLPLAGYGALVLGVAEIAGGRLMTGLFGPDFAGSRAVFVILCVAISWNAIGLPAGYSLIGEQRNRHFLRGAAVAGMLNLVLMVALIPPMGATGAAIATSVALTGGALMWIRLAGVLRRILVVLILLAMTSLGGAVAAWSAELAVPIGVVTLLVGAALVANPFVSRSG